MNTNINRGVWSEDEHDRFLQAIQVYPRGPWRYVAKHVGTRDVRQVQTHAQKYYEKVGRHMRGLRKERRSWVRSEHRIDDLPSGLQRPMGTPGASSASIPQRLHSMPSTSTSSAPASASAPIYIPTTHTEQAATHPWLLADTAHSAPEIGFLELPSLEDSLDLLLEYLSD